MSKGVVGVFFAIGLFGTAYLLLSIPITMIYISTGTLTAFNFATAMPQLIGITALLALIPCGLGVRRLLKKGVDWE